MQQMLLKHEPIVKIIVAKMRSRLPAHADLEELHSIGLTGLISAIERFDESRGYSFETYASIRVRGAILDSLRAMDMMPRSVRTKQRKLNAVLEQLEQELGRTPTDEELRLELGMEPKQFQKLRAQTRPLNIIFLDRSSEAGEVSPHDLIADESQEDFPEKIERRELQELVARKILELPKQQQKVLALYFHEGLRLAEIGEMMGISEARVSQIRSQALAHLRKFVARMSY